MNSDDLFMPTSDSDPWSGSVARLDGALLESLTRAPSTEIDDAEAAVVLARLVHDNLTLFGTSGNQEVVPADMIVALRTLKALCGRLGLEIDIPWRDYDGFRAYWLRRGAKGSWQARRDLLEEIFEPIHSHLESLEQDRYAHRVAEGVSVLASGSWEQVEAEIRELRKRFASASTPQDFRAVGTHCVGVLEALSRTVYDAGSHLRDGESEPSVDKTKQRIGRFVEDAAPGPSNAEIRVLVTKAVDAAQMVKHRQTPTRRDAGIAADTVVLLAHILRRLAGDQ